MTFAHLFPFPIVHANVFEIVPLARYASGRRPSVAERRACVHVFEGIAAHD